jgi:hypothetical protein
MRPQGCSCPPIPLKIPAKAGIQCPVSGQGWTPVAPATSGLVKRSGLKHPWPEPAGELPASARPFFACARARYLALEPQRLGTPNVWFSPFSNITQAVLPVDTTMSRVAPMCASASRNPGMSAQDSSLSLRVRIDMPEPCEVLSSASIVYEPAAVSSATTSG